MQESRIWTPDDCTISTVRTDPFLWSTNRTSPPPDCPLRDASEGYVHLSSIRRLSSAKYSA